MDSTQIYRILTRRIRRGLILFFILKIISVVSCAYIFITDGMGPWVALLFIAVVIFIISLQHLRKRAMSALKISQDPKIVYWGHPRTAYESLSSEMGSVGKYKILMLHLRDATQFEVNLRLKQMNDFVAWLKENNSTIRWGPYDAECSDDMN